MKKIQDLVVLYDKKTLLYLEGEEVSFITVLPLIQELDMEIAQSTQIENYTKRIEDLVNKLETYDEGSIFRKAKLGATYKIISKYKKLSPLQRYVREKDFDSEFVLNQKKEERKKLNFKEMKIQNKMETILNVDEYDKKDYIVIKTNIPTDDFKFLNKNETLKEKVISLKEEDIEIFKNEMEIFYHRHKKDYEDIEYDKSLIIENELILEVLSDLSLTISKTHFYDLENFNNNLLNDNSQGNAIQYDIFKTKTSIPETIKINQKYVSINKNGKIKYHKLFKGDIPKLNVIDKKNGEYEFLIENGNIKNVISKGNVYNIEQKQEKSYIKSFTLSEIPLSFKENISKQVERTLKGYGFEEFVIITEIIKKPAKVQESELEGLRKTYELITQIPSINDKLYNKNRAFEKLAATTSMIYWIGEGKQFNNVRFSFSVKTDYDNEKLEELLQTRFDKDGLEFELLKFNMSNICLPYNYFNFNSINEKSLLLENKEVSKLINLEYGNSYFHNRKDTTEEELSKIFQSNFYLRTKDKVMGVNIFDGPEAFNGLIMAPTGSGKSFFMVNLIDGFMTIEDNPITWIIDRGGSYDNFTNIQGGINIKIKQSSNRNCVNPYSFDENFAKMIFIENYVTEEALLLMENKKHKKEDTELFDKYVKDLELPVYTLEEFNKLDDTRKENIDAIVIDEEGKKKPEFTLSNPSEKLGLFEKLLQTMLGIETLEDFGVVSKLSEYVPYVLTKLIIKTINSIKEERKWLLISEIKNELKSVMLEKSVNEEDKKQLEKELDTYLSNLDKYINPLLNGKLFEGKPNLDFSSNLINLDFGEIQDDDLQNLILSSLILNFFNIMTDKRLLRRRKLIVIDEAHGVLNADSISGIKSVAYLYRTARKWNSAVWAISQKIGDFKKLSSESASVGKKLNMFEGMVGNAKWHVLLGKHEYLETTERLGYPENIAKKIEKPEGFNFFISSKVSGFCSLLLSNIDYAIATTHAEEKGILSMLDLLSNNTKKKLLLFAEIFGMSFVSDYQNVRNFKNLLGDNNKIESLEKQLRKLLDIKGFDFETYWDDLKTKLERLKKSGDTDSVAVINAILTKIEVDNKIEYFRKIIINEIE